MGANEFRCTTTAKTARDAFCLVVQRAKQEARERAEHDELDCSDEAAVFAGTIAAKDDFEMTFPRLGESVPDCIKRCMSDESHFATDKWDSAACIDGGADPQRPGYRIFHFFGLAPT